MAYEKRYGSIQKGNGYFDLCKDFTAKGFDPAQWADLVQESGAKYAGTCAVHHDGYLMWDSKVTDFCAGKTGAKKDLIGKLFKELEKRDIKTIASFHHARTKKFFDGWKKQLAKNPDYAKVDLLQNKCLKDYWYMGSKDEFLKNRMDITNEFITKYKPNVIWFDGGATDSPLEILSTFYNTGVNSNKEVEVHNKDRQFGDAFGVYSYERGYLRPHSLLNHPWEDDETSSISGSWAWWHGINYKPASDLVKRLCHLVANNGGLLLSLNPRPDGAFDPEMIAQLKGIGKWLKQNDEAIHGSRPWKIQGEGHMDPLELRYVWSKAMQDRYATPNVTKFRASDFRFTTQKEALYAIQMGVPTNGKARIKSLSSKNKIGSGNEILEVSLLGYGKVKFVRNDEFLEIKLPKKLPNSIALVYKIKVKGKLERILYQGKR
jgi:alpha-L-fucosidase